VIVADTSVWIDHFRRAETPELERLRSAVYAGERVVVGDLILLEVLQGASTESMAAGIEGNLRAFDVETMLDDKLAVTAARNYRLLRSKGITIRRTIDMVIGTFCLERGYALLHKDRDFEPMREHLGLRVVETGP